MSRHILSVFMCGLIVLVVFTVFVGCSSSSLDDKSTPTVGLTPQPVTIIDALERTLSFGDVPKTIATISPTATEMLYAAGGTSALRDRASTFPKVVQSVSDVGSAYDPSIETILASNPDLVVIEALTQARFLPVLGQSGLKVMAVKAETVDDVKNGILNLGKIIQQEDIASAKVREIEEKLTAVRNDDNRSVLLLISDQDQNLYAARPESYTGLIAGILGMENKAAGLADSGPYPGFAMISLEAILIANPDVIVTISPAPEPAPRLSETLAHIPPFAGLKAMQNGNVIEADVELFLQAPGPRIADAVEFLKESLAAKSD
jgi:iron complex transport system substrate-binding protein